MNQFTVSKDLHATYDNYYETRESKWRQLGAIGKADNIRELCKGLSIDSVIEIGAGEGSILKRLSDLHFAKGLYALEISTSGISALKQTDIPRLKACAVFNGYDIPYCSDKFDLAVLSHVIEHVEYPRRLLYEAGRVAKYVFVEVPLEDTMRLQKDFIPDKVGHINFYSPKTIRRLLQTCNLEVLRQKTTNPSKEVYIFQKGRAGLYVFYLKQWLLKFAPFLTTKIFTYHCAILAITKNKTKDSGC